MVTPITTADIRFEWPRRQLPIYFIIDDPAPCLNLAHYEQYWEPHIRDIPNDFTAAFADLIEEFGVRGKFTVLPVPAAIGRIDRPLPDVKPADQQEFLQIARARIAPRMDIGIEFLTHFLAWDIRRECPLDYTEKTMGPFVNRAHLTEYLAYGLRILHDLGLGPTGATSPGIACRDIEWTYQAALADAVRDVTGSSLTWYFLHVDDRSPVVLPRLMALDRERGAGCVSVLSMTGDPSWQTQWGEPSELDILLTEDGQAGRLAELHRNHSPLGFHTHWQSLFSEGRGTGLQDLRTTLGRIREHFGDTVQWTRCSDLARVVTTQAATQVTMEQDAESITIRLASPIACPDFTACLGADVPVRGVRVGDKPLRRLPDGDGALESGTWRRTRAGIAWCANLPAGELTLNLESYGG